MGTDAAANLPAWIPALLPAALAGLVLGGVFFGGLLWTVRRALASRRPAPWLLVSLLVRAGGALAAIAWLGAGQWPRMLACLIGFMVARRLVRLLALRAPVAHVAAEDAVHAPQPR